MLILTYLYSITQCGLANYTKKKKKKPLSAQGSSYELLIFGVSHARSNFKVLP